MSELDLTFKSKKLILAENLQQGGGGEGGLSSPLKQNQTQRTGAVTDGQELNPNPSEQDAKARVEQTRHGARFQVHLAP